MSGWDEMPTSMALSLVSGNGIVVKLIVRGKNYTADAVFGSEKRLPHMRLLY
jgi:hypothetical protein